MLWLVVDEELVNDVSYWFDPVTLQFGLACCSDSLSKSS